MNALKTTVLSMKLPHHNVHNGSVAEILSLMPTSNTCSVILFIFWQMTLLLFRHRIHVERSGTFSLLKTKAAWFGLQIIW